MQRKKKEKKQVRKDPAFFTRNHICTYILHTYSIPAPTVLTDAASGDDDTTAIYLKKVLMCDSSVTTYIAGGEGARQGNIERVRLQATYVEYLE